MGGGKSSKGGGGGSGKEDEEREKLICFHPSAIVETPSELIKMGELKVDATVRAHSGWTQVYAFSHAD